MRHFRALDGLRAFAVLIVFAGHLRGTPLPGGFIGVDVFFVLSGFLITGLLVREHAEHGSVSLRAFFWRRVLRLYPALLLLCVVVLPMAAVSRVYDVRSTAVGLGSALLYCFNLAGVFRHTPTMVGNLWSLSVEEQYYLLWAPAAVWLLARGRLSGRVLAALVAIGWLVLVATAVVFGRRGMGQAYFQLHGHLTELLLGGLLAWAYHSGALGRLTGVLGGTVAPTVAIVLLLVAARTIGRVDGLGMVLTYPLLAVSSAVVIGHLVLGRGSWISLLLEHPAAIWLGRRSYAFYLFHRPVIHLVEEHLSSRLLVTAVSMLVSLGLAGLSWQLVERPALTRKRRFERVPVSA